MIKIKIHTPIEHQSANWWYTMYDDSSEQGVFSLAWVQRLFEENSTETDFLFNIHCPGGSVEEGLAIYDFLRTSGKNIYMNIEGMCHSMAVTLLLAAPKENRSANPNCRALIHKVFGCAWEGTAEDFERAAKEVRSLQNSILSIYADRTDLTLEEAQNIMYDESEHTVQELVEWGFVSRINSYNTNIKSNHRMKTNKKTLRERATEFVNSVKNLIKAKNFDFTDEDGTVLFSTEAEDETLEVGMPASPDGEYTIQDGRTVVISDGAITEIREPSGEGGEENELENLRAENAQLRASLAEATGLIREFNAKNTGSSYQPAQRMGTAGQANKPAENKQLTSAERKAAIKEKLNKK